MIDSSREMKSSSVYIKAGVAFHLKIYFKATGTNTKKQVKAIFKFQRAGSGSISGNPGLTL